MQENLTKCVVYLLGRPDLLKELLAYAVRNELGCRCTSIRNLHLIDEADDENTTLILVDASDEHLDEFLLDLRYEGGAEEPRWTVALYNMETGQMAEREAMMRGVRGFFYHGDPLQLVVKGIRAMFDGELWLSREVLADLVMRGGAEPDRTGPDVKLTRRETEILAHVGLGRTNDEIAAKLSISTHTVKTHLYRVFKKIGVENRFQAALWAAKHV